MDKKGFVLDVVGASSQEKFRHLIGANCFGLGLNRSIYRILPFDYLMAFLEEGVFTYSKPDKKNWGDKYEAYLAGVEFSVDCEQVVNGALQKFKAPLTMKSALKDTYASCWTKVKAESNTEWTSFSMGKPSVRIKSTPRKLLAGGISTQDKWFELSNFIGEVDYLPESEFKRYFDDTPYQEHLDSLGRGLAQSFFTLTEKFKKEKEVRLLYVHYPDENSWVSQNVSICGLRCTTPFEWSNVIEGISIWPGGLSAAQIKKLKGALTNAETLCHIS